MIIWEVSKLAGSLLAYTIVASNTDEKYHSLVMAVSFASHPFLSGGTWEDCAISAGIGLATAIIIDKLNWRDEQWNSLNRKFEEGSEQFNLQLQEKEVGNNWVILSYQNELTGNFEEREPISSAEFKHLLTQLNDKEQEISLLKDKINISTNFTNEEKKILEGLNILHSKLKKDGEEKIHEIEQLTEELEIEQERAQVMDKWYRENIAENLSQEIALLKKRKNKALDETQTIEQPSVNQISNRQRLVNYLRQIPNPFYYLKSSGVKTVILCLGIYKTTSYLKDNLYARYQLEDLLNTKVILTDEEKEMLIFLYKDGGLTHQIPVDRTNKEKIAKFIASNEEAIKLFQSNQKNYPSLGGAVSSLLSLGIGVKQSSESFESLKKQAIEIIGNKNYEINQLKSQVTNLEKRLEGKQEAKIQQPAPNFRPWK